MEAIVVYTKFNDQNKAAIYNKWLPVLSPELKAKNLKYHNQDDRIRNLLGKLLLIKALELSGRGYTSLNDLYNNEFGKSYLSSDFDFNITHSGSYVFCAIGSSSLGIDIEEILPLDFTSVKESMNKTEWGIINNAKSPLHEYYKYWTIKESVIKADGRGFSISLDKIRIENNQVRIEDKTWYIRKLFFEKGYCGCLATLEIPNLIKMIYINFD
ncbi:4'-phosphopantetheinyl transferase family protein [Flavobacterium sp.]|uniref:4'-phosphopantetheinyl transferase family protein n=1 Tax=Flavobacterium sp. TaxID=239 RepID=UPI003D127176